MAEKKTNEIRDTTETVTEQPMVLMQRGNTTFLIGLHYAEKGKETLEDKVKKLIRKDMEHMKQFEEECRSAATEE